MFERALASAYNEGKDTDQMARCKQVFIVTELYNVNVKFGAKIQQLLERLLLLNIAGQPMVGIPGSQTGSVPVIQIV